MKRFILSITMLLTVCLTTMAMSYEQARERALFLTDKMAYELNLNDEQYEAAYEVNLDYLMSINDYDDLYGTYWTRRNLDLSYILFDWQYNAFCAATYFYRPLTWADGIWRFGIYARYPNRAYFYFGRPAFYATYYGAHSWRMNGGHSWYHGRTFGPRPGESRFGMRDRFDRGDFKSHRNGNFNNSRNDRRDNRGNFRRDNRQNTDKGHIDRNNGGNNGNSRFDGNNNGNGNFKGGRTGSTTSATPIRQNRSWEKASTQQQPMQMQQTQKNVTSGRTLRQSSTRTTVTRDTPTQSTPSRAIRNESTFSRPSTSTTSRPASTFTPSSRSAGNFSSGASQSSGRSGGGGHFGGRR